MSQPQQAGQIRGVSGPVIARLQQISASILMLVADRASSIVGVDRDQCL